ncbi:uncharacterized protein DS421_18g616920 [Arachis hypogaea]|nr:uncharacterized protein DS421_18g616920 [Arachis hypogaea]
MESVLYPSHGASAQPHAEGDRDRRRRRKNRALRVSAMEEGVTFEGLRESEHDGGFETEGAVGCGGGGSPCDARYDGERSVTSATATAADEAGVMERRSNSVTERGTSSFDMGRV